MNKGKKGSKRQVDRCWPRTSRANFNRQERAIERHIRQESKKLIRKAVEQ